MSARILQKIMYVDDASDLRMMVEVTLGRIGGYEMLLCDSGDEALLKAPDFKPDFILLDVMMPGMDGPETLQALRKIPVLSQVPVAFMTSKTMNDEIDYYKSLGAVDVINKPFDPMSLAPHIEKIWAKTNI